MPQKPPAKAPRGSWSQATASRMQQKPVARASRGIWRQATAQRRFLKPLEKPLESAQNAAKASGEAAARQLKPGYCPQNAATACGKGAARDLEAGYCLTSLSETTRKALGKRPECRKMPQKPPAKAPRGIWRCSQNAAKACGEAAARHLKPGYCPQNAAKCLTPLFLGRAPPADGWGRRINMSNVWNIMNTIEHLIFPL